MKELTDNELASLNTALFIIEHEIAEAEMLLGETLFVDGIRKKTLREWIYQLREKVNR